MSMLSSIINFFVFIRDYKWYGFLTYFIPVYWIQDTQFKNNGRDIWTFKPIGKPYFKGTMTERNKLWIN